MSHYLDEPPPSEQRVAELHVWIATHPDGAEGIASADVDFGPGFGIRHLPLLSSQRGTAEKMHVWADELRQQALVQAGKRVHLRLVTFRKVEE